MAGVVFRWVPLLAPLNLPLMVIDFLVLSRYHFILKAS
ncbi:uncharacterized protein MP3633_1825 [Marinomonas primoryensis]|uniref:Uncharacterized protein n=1 Tax=Marinomonas primoryensis TaxID=178399 RepID=A0A859CVH5_9GAMM|nr:uncharacterized protein MP3633_1825 [Marinomonas primoryensis]